MDRGKVGRKVVEVSSTEIDHIGNAGMSSASKCRYLIFSLATMDIVLFGDYELYSLW